jgi:carbamate kinase
VQVERSEDEDATSETADTVESGAEDQSQELGTSPAKRSGQIGQIMETVVDQQRRIRDTRKQKVLESYDNAYTTAQSSIGTLFDDHEKQA